MLLIHLHVVFVGLKNGETVPLGALIFSVSAGTGSRERESPFMQYF